MARELNFNVLEDKGEAADLEQRSWRSRRRESNPTIQMSVRMREDVYERFRALAQRERRTNGDLLELMLEQYLRKEAKGG